jgi:NAD(P)H-dependent flavin oxidoreductase YrpB (nitropropane dioxygenase family)
VLTTPFTGLVGIDAPIIQAPIGGLVTPQLAAAVSNAGALGMLNLTWTDPEAIERHISEMRTLTDRPFGVNLILKWPQAERLRACLDAGARIFSFFWGDPSPHVDAIHSADGLVLTTVGSAEEARRMVRSGVDVVVAQGWEAGGHVWGEVATMPLVPAVVDAVAPVPVVAAGGIADGRGLAAALALGASAVWMGTRFVLATESNVHPRYRELLLAASETDTALTRLFDVGWSDAPHRTIRNSTVRSWELAGRPPHGSRPGEGDVVVTEPDGTTIVRYSATSPRSEIAGDVEALSLWAGQSVGLAREIRPAAAIVASVVAEAELVVDRLGRAGHQGDHDPEG